MSSPFCHFHHSLSLFFHGFPLHSHLPPLPAALSRSAVLHGMSEDAIEPCTPVTVLSAARRESSKKPVRQRPRRRRRASERPVRAEEQAKARRSDFHLQTSSPRWRELGTDSAGSSTSDDSEWIQAKRRARVKFRLSRRRRRNHNEACGNMDGPPANGIELGDVGTKGEKEQELVGCASCSSSLHRRKAPGYQGCRPSLPKRSFEMKSSSRSHEESPGRYRCRDPQLEPSLRKHDTVKTRVSDTDSNPEVPAATDGGQCVAGAGLQVTSPVPKPPTTCDDGSDNLEVCRSVAAEEGLLPSKYISSHCELGVCLMPYPENIAFTHTGIFF